MCIKYCMLYNYIDFEEDVNDIEHLSNSDSSEVDVNDIESEEHLSNSDSSEVSPL